MILGVEVPFFGLMSVVSARLGNKRFGALLLFLLILFKLVSGSAPLLVFMAWDASNESLFSWICSVERQFHSRANLNMYRWWHGITCIQPWKAQLASHKSCNVSTRVYNRCSVRVGFNSHNVYPVCKMYIKAYILQFIFSDFQLFTFLDSKKIDPNPGAHSDCHTETQTHKHTDTHNKQIPLLISQPKWKYIWSDFCQLLSNSS